MPGTANGARGTDRPRAPWAGRQLAMGFNSSRLPALLDQSKVRCDRNSRVGTREQAIACSNGDRCRPSPLFGARECQTLAQKSHLGAIGVRTGSGGVRQQKTIGRIRSGGEVLALYRLSVTGSNVVR